MASAWTRSALAGPIADPYVEWNEETDHVYLFAASVDRAQQRFPVVIELSRKKGLTAQGFAAMVATRKDLGRFIRVSDLYARPPRGLEPAVYCTGSVTRDFFTEVWPQDLRESIRRYELGAPVPGAVTPRSLRSSVKKSRANPPYEIVTALIDDGVAFAHERFRRAAVPRMEFFWNQDNGSELDRAQIQNFFTGCTHGGVVDEDELYAVSGQIDYALSQHKPLAQRATHGAHVMDLAAGADHRNAPLARPIIGVQLPVATTADTSGATLAPQVLDALRYILNRADALLAPPARVVVNLSYGTNAGPHDGSSILEKAMDELLTLRQDRLQIVLPAGNSYQARCHARLDLGKGKEDLLQWRVQPEDRTPSFQEIWLAASSPGNKRNVEIKVIPPTGDESEWVQEGEEHVWRPRNDILCKVLHLPASGARKRAMVFIALAPTATLHATRDIAPCGTWTIRVRNRASKTVTLDAWIQRDDTPFGYPLRGRQSRFSDRIYECRDHDGRLVDADNVSPIKRAGTINAIATGALPVVIGGFRRKDQRVAWYSAAGSNATPGGGVAIREPDALAVSDDSPAADGLLAAGARTGSVAAINGTSVAAPRIAQWIADQMALGRTSGRAAVQGQAVPPNAPHPPIPPLRGGSGLIELPPLVDRRIEK